ncbi:MAG: chemotaxis protein CheB [Agarilytica sp.]
MASLNLGLLADTTMELSKLESVVSHAKYSVASSLLTRFDDLENLPNVDCWVVSVDMDDERSQALVDKLDNQGVPIIYDEADGEKELNLDERARRFSKKIASCGFGSEYKSENLHRADYVWVLAASAGGPEAVLRFLQKVPPMDNVALVYVQHMDEAMLQPMIKSLKRNCEWDVHLCDRAMSIYERRLYVISPAAQVDINEIGAFSPTQTPWQGDYRPSVDQMVAKIWRQFGKNSGVIVFSGMGNDGARTCRMIKNAGGQVWVQSPESCAVDSMPKEVINTHCVGFVGAPEHLATHFSVYHKKLSHMNSEPKEEKHHD